MSSEIRFATSNSDFWNELLPMADAFIRAQNAHPSFFANPVMAFTPTNQRAVVNEAAFSIFEQSVGREVSSSLTTEEIAEVLHLAFNRNEKFPNATKPDIHITLSLGRLEATSIARNLISYFFGKFPISHPMFLGCGRIDEAEADVLCAGTLYEIKAGDRHFRLTDLRQILVYCALNFSSKQHVIQEVALINPRSGTILKIDLEELCKKVSGTSAVRVLGDIVSFICEPSLGYTK